MSSSSCFSLQGTGIPVCLQDESLNGESLRDESDTCYFILSKTDRALMGLSVFCVHSEIKLLSNKVETEVHLVNFLKRKSLFC